MIKITSLVYQKNQITSEQITLFSLPGVNYLPDYQYVNALLFRFSRIVNGQISINGVGLSSTSSVFEPFFLGLFFNTYGVVNIAFKTRLELLGFLKEFKREKASVVKSSSLFSERFISLFWSLLGKFDVLYVVIDSRKISSLFLDALLSYKKDDFSFPIFVALRCKKGSFSNNQNFELLTKTAVLSSFVFGISSFLSFSYFLYSLSALRSFESVLFAIGFFVNFSFSLVSLYFLQKKSLSISRLLFKREKISSFCLCYALGFSLSFALSFLLKSLLGSYGAILFSGFCQPLLFLGCFLSFFSFFIRCLVVQNLFRK